MNPNAFFLLSSSDSEEDERIIRRRLRERSDPLALSNTAFVKRFRLTKEAFLFVLEELNLKYLDAKAVPPVLQLALTLSILATGGYQHSIGSDYLLGMSQSTVCKIFSTVLEEIEKKLCTKHIKFVPNESTECKQWFYEKHKLPGVVGCIDGTHIGLQKPTENEHMYFNRKGFHSLNVMIICDHKYQILALNCRYGGAAHDSFVWKHSNQRTAMENLFQLNRNRNSWLLADSGYPLEPWCITPYRNARDGSSEALFNEKHSKARCIVERTIGILKGRWRILGYDKRGRYCPIKVARFTNACAALHNICIQFKINYTPNSNAIEVNDVYIAEEDQLYRLENTIRDQIKYSLSN